MKREERLAKKQREDQALNRVLWWFGGAVILEFFLLLLNRFYINFDASGVSLAKAIFQFLSVFAWVCLAAFVVFFALWLVQRKKKGKTMLPGVGTLVSLSLFVCAFVAGMWKAVGVQFLYVGVPVVAVLALIYYLYQREFFLVALQGGMALFSMWAYRKMIYVSDRAVYVIFVLAGVLAVASAVLAYLLQRHKGRLGKVRVLPKRTNYIPLYIAPALTAAALIITLLLGRTAAYAALFAVVAWLFAAAAYYTVRLM